MDHPTTGVQWRDPTGHIHDDVVVPYQDEEVKQSMKPALTIEEVTSFSSETQQQITAPWRRSEDAEETLDGRFHPKGRGQTGYDKQVKWIESMNRSREEAEASDSEYILYVKEELS